MPRERWEFPWLGVLVGLVFLLTGFLSGCGEEKWERWKIEMNGVVYYVWVGGQEMVDRECRERLGEFPAEVRASGCYAPTSQVIITLKGNEMIAIHETCHALVGSGHVKCGYPQKVEG